MDRRTVVLLFFAIFTTGAAAKLVLEVAQSVPKPTPKPPPPPPRLPDSSSAIYTANLAFQDPAGGTSAAPNYESVHLMADGRIASIGWIGIHADNFSNAIFAFNPATRAVDLLASWEQYVSAQDLTPKVPPVRGAGYNKHCGTHDNHPSAYFAATNSLIWFGHCVFDVTAGKYLKGDRPPMTGRWTEYATGYDWMWLHYNPIYAQCLALNQVAFYGASYGGSGNPYDLLVWRHTGPVDAPWQATRFDLSATGIAGLARARNNGACIGTKMYVGGGEGGQRQGSVTNSVFRQPGHGYKDGYEVAGLPDSGQAGMPVGLVFAQTYYIRDATVDTFRLAATRGGLALTVGDKTPWSFGQQYKMWSIDLATTPPTVALVNTEFNLGGMDTYGQLLAMGSKLVMIGKKVCIYDPATNQWADVPITGWPSGGFQRVGGAYSGGKIYFRGWPYTAGNGFPQAFQWNSLEFV